MLTIKSLALKTLTVGETVSFFRNGETRNKIVKDIIRKIKGRAVSVAEVNISDIDKCTIFFTDGTFTKTKNL